MFGIGGSEIIVILVIALLFLGPDKLPDAAKTISKGIRDLKKQSRALQQQIESDEKIGGAIRDLKSALRGEDFPTRPPVRVEPPKEQAALAAPTGEAEATASTDTDTAAEPPAHVLTLPETAGESDPDVKDETPVEDIGALIKPAPGTVAKNDSGSSPSENEAQPPASSDEPNLKHG